MCTFTEESTFHVSNSLCQFVCNGKIQPCLEDDILRVLHANHNDDDNQNQQETQADQPNRFTEKWMILCNQHPSDSAMEEP